MTAYTGEVLSTTGFSRQDDISTVLCKVSWTAALTTADTLTIADAIPEGKKLLIDDVEIYGTQPDAHATPTLGLKAGVNGDDDAFLAATVITAKEQLLLKGTGASIGTTIEDKTDIVLTPTANPATNVTSGDFYVKLTGRSQMK